MTSASLFEHLFDDAAIFPPGNAPMDRAVEQHLMALGTNDARFIGPFVCSDVRMDELQMMLDGERIAIALTTTVDRYPTAVHAALKDPRLSLISVEIKTPDVLTPVTELPTSATAFLELPWGARPDLPPGTALKLRTGGETAEAFPDEVKLARALTYCLEQDVSFKLTAGLHNAIRHTDSHTGFEHHGFLNVILAIAAALDTGTKLDAVTSLETGGTADIAEVLAQRDPAVVTANIAALDDTTVKRIRHYFRSFGTCSTSEPLADLRALGLIEESST